MNADTTLRNLSKIKKEIIDLSKEREELMIEYLKIKRRVMSLQQLIGNKQRDMLRLIP